MNKKNHFVSPFFHISVWAYCIFHSNELLDPTLFHQSTEPANIMYYIYHLFMLNLTINELLIFFGYNIPCDSNSIFDPDVLVHREVVSWKERSLLHPNHLNNAEFKIKCDGN